jgi:Xaa-Pro aminopeptidase
MSQAGPAKPRLDALRTVLAARGVDGFVLPVADPHLGEYMPDHDRRVAWLTGFTGSAGVVLVLKHVAAVLSDGRYVLQLAAQTDGAVWTRGHMVETPPPSFLAALLAGAPARIGYDPWLMSADTVQKYRDAGLAMVPLAPNPVDAIWTDQPPPPETGVAPHRLDVAGIDAAEKRAAVAADLARSGQDAAILSDPASVNWLLNIRGTDVECTPFALGFAIIDRDARVDLFMAPSRLDPDARSWLGNAVAVHAPDRLEPVLATYAGRKVRVDPAATAAWFGETLRARGALVEPGPDPCALPKARKNPVEQAGARTAHRTDGVALCRFLHALQERDDLTELSAAALLNSFRAADPAYRGESFPAISGAGPDGAIMHYRVTAETDRALRPDEPYLIDSGGQYPSGTTDVTRTVWRGPAAPPEALRAQYTWVLAGHLDLAALVFPEGIAGSHIDALARRALWRTGLDYDHGTGHGVGSFLAVHEGPAGISRTARPVPLAEGMILSNEPGYYLPGQYGIRIENLELVVRADLPDAARPFLRFETLTLAPYDRALIAPDLLTPAQRAQVDAYHARVRDVLTPLLPPDAAHWLAGATAEL